MTRENWTKEAKTPATRQGQLLVQSWGLRPQAATEHRSWALAHANRQFRMELKIKKMQKDDSIWNKQPALICGYYRIKRGYTDRIAWRATLRLINVLTIATGTAMYPKSLTCLSWDHKIQGTALYACQHVNHGLVGEA